MIVSFKYKAWKKTKGSCLTKIPQDVEWGGVKRITGKAVSKKLSKRLQTAHSPELPMYKVFHLVGDSYHTDGAFSQSPFIMKVS